MSENLADWFVRVAASMYCTTCWYLPGNIWFLKPSINKISEAKVRQEPACFIMPLGATVQHVYVSGTYWGTSSPPVICPLVGAAHVLMAFALQLGYKAWVMSIEPWLEEELHHSYDRYSVGHVLMWFSVKALLGSGTILFWCLGAVGILRDDQISMKRIESCHELIWCRSLSWQDFPGTYLLRHPFEAYPFLDPRGLFAPVALSLDRHFGGKSWWWSCDVLAKWCEFECLWFSSLVK